MSKAKKFVPSEQFLRDNGVKFPEIIFRKFGNDERMYFDNYQTIKDFQTLIDYLGWTCEKLRDDGFKGMLNNLYKKFKEPSFKIKFPRENRDLKNSTNEELTELIKPYKRRSELIEADSTLYRELLSRGLIDILFPRENRDFKNSTNEELIELANSLGRSKINNSHLKALRDHDIEKLVIRKHHTHPDEPTRCKEDISELIKKYKIQDITDLDQNHGWIRSRMETLKLSTNDFIDDFLNFKKTTSSLNKRTGDWLTKVGIPYEKEVYIKTKERRNLKLDFLIKVGSYTIVLEPGGQQHLIKNDFFHKTEEDFKDSKIRDICKFNFCKENNIIIRYWFEFSSDKRENIEKATKFLKENNYMGGEAIYFLDEEEFHREILNLYNYYSNLENDSDLNLFSENGAPDIIYWR